MNPGAVPDSQVSGVPNFLAILATLETPMVPEELGNFSSTFTSPVSELFLSEVSRFPFLFKKIKKNRSRLPSCLTDGQMIQEKATALLDQRGTVLDSRHQALRPPSFEKHATSLAIEKGGIRGRERPEKIRQARKEPQHKATVSALPQGLRGQ